MQITQHFNRSNIMKYAAAAIVAEGAYYYFKTRRKNAGATEHHNGFTILSDDSSSSSKQLAGYDDQESRIDSEAAESFPASDPPSYGHSVARVSMDSAML
jgi:hypothetical protein